MEAHFPKAEIKGGYLYLDGKAVYVGNPYNQFTFENKEWAGTFTYHKWLYENEFKRRDYKYKKDKKYSAFEYKKNAFENRAKKLFSTKE